VANYEATEDPCWKFALFGTAFTCIAIVIVGTVLMYVFYTSGIGCSLNVFFITFNLIICLLIMVCSVLPRVQEVRLGRTQCLLPFECSAQMSRCNSFVGALQANPKSGILQASILAAVLTYMTLSAINSEPIDADFSCTTQSTTDGFSQALFYIGFIGSFMTLTFSAFSAGGLTDPGLNQDGDIDEDVRTAAVTP